MPVQLSSLRVVADIDAQGFARGAAQVKRSQDDMAAGARTLSATMTDAQGKISAAGNPIERLSRQYVDGYGSARRMESGLRTLSRALDAGRIDASQAERIYTGLAQKLGLVASAADVTAEGYFRLGAVVDRVNAKLARQPAPGSGGISDGDASFRRRNLTYQAVDVLQMAALGQAPYMLAMQQGPQILQLYTGPGGVTAALADARMVAMGLSRVLPGVATAALGVGLAFGSISNEVERATGKAASFGEVMKATFTLVMNAIRPVTDVVSGTIGWVAKNLGSAAVDIAEMVLNSAKGVGYDLAWLWDNAGTVIKSKLYDIANAGVDAFNSMAAKITEKVNAMIDGINNRFGTTYERFASDSLSITRFNNPYADAAARALEMRRQGLLRISAEQPIRDFGRRIAGQTESNRAVADLQALGSVSFADAVKGASQLSGQLSQIGKQASVIGAEAKSAHARVIDLGAAWDAAKRSEVASAMETASQLRTAQEELKKTQAMIKSAAETPVSKVFGDTAQIANAQQIIDAAVGSINKVFNAFDEGRLTTGGVFESIELVRKALLSLGGDAESVNRFVDGLIKAQLQARTLQADVKSLSNEIKSIPNRVISIRISQTVEQAQYPGGQTVYRGTNNYAPQIGYGVGPSQIGTINYPGYGTAGLYDVGGEMKSSYDLGYYEHFATGGTIAPSGSGSSDTRFIQMMTRPDETISIHTPQQRKAVVDAMDRAGEGRGGDTISFGDIHINLPAGADPRQAQVAGRAAADEFVSRIRSAMGPRLHG
ncbi:phage tail length tape measure family protein [Aquamicrobium soli]|uniref:Phage tail length tape measure family protein n=1 Tax=Aquamicrobium soli TaxID=1811518 RepID=A0ABV7K9D6_9HYPH